MKILADFVAGLKDRLRKIPDSELAQDRGCFGSTQTGWMPEVEVDYERLDREIDEFCRQFEQQRASQVGAGCALPSTGANTSTNTHAG